MFFSILQTFLYVGDFIKHNLDVFNQFDKDNINL